MFGPQAAYYSELFGPRVRYGGFAFARELGSILLDAIEDVLESGSVTPDLGGSATTAAMGAAVVARFRELSEGPTPERIPHATRAEGS